MSLLLHAPLSHTLLLVSLLLAASSSFASGAGSQELDIPYVPNGGHKQQLDLYTPDRPGFATVLLVHGGSLETGDRKESPFPQICQAFQKAAFGCAAMSYRLFPEHWPAQPADVAAAFAWLKASIGAHGGDPTRLFLLGHSSGARLVALVSSDETYLKEHGLSARDIAGTVVMGTILHIEDWLKEVGGRDYVEKYFPQTDEAKTYSSFVVFRNAWPYYHVGAHLPPMLILVAEAERLQPPCLAHAEEFSRAAAQVGAHVKVKVLEGRTHLTAIETMPAPGDPTFSEILGFLDAIAGKH